MDAYRWDNRSAVPMAKYGHTDRKKAHFRNDVLSMSSSVGHARIVRAPPPFFLGVRSCHSVKSDSVHTCTETVFIIQEILRAKSDSGASMQCVCRPTALPYPYGRRLEGATACPRTETHSRPWPTPPRIGNAIGLRSLHPRQTWQARPPA
jgi:hypothetical protein